MKKHYIFLSLIFVSYNLFIKAAPIPALCTPKTTSYNPQADFGILNVTFNTINNTTAGGADGYKDYSGSINTNLLAGQVYNISINVSGGSPGKQNVRVWIDYNNNGALDSIKELAFSANSTLLATGIISIPGTAVLNTELRMRVSADYELANPLGPCRDQQYGQTEDYSVTIITNPNPPQVFFHAESTTTCDGAVSFFDDSQNVPTSWLWDFGDGNTSIQQNPVHTYTMNGTYTVKLRADNANGADIDSLVNYIQVTLGSAPVQASCTPLTIEYCCNHGINKVVFNTISNSSLDASEGYKDFSCTKQTSLIKGNSYNLSVETGTSNYHDVKAWIDYDNDGVFNSTSELVFNKTNEKNPSALVSISSSASIYDTPLRMRIIADNTGNPISPCTNPFRGQAEDYTIIIPTPQSVKENDSEMNLSVFPNPTEGIITLNYQFTGLQHFSVFIFNGLGQEVLRENLSDNKTYQRTFDLSNNPVGIYFIKIINGDRQIARKVILQ